MIDITIDILWTLSSRIYTSYSTAYTQHSMEYHVEIQEVSAHMKFSQSFEQSIMKSST